LERMHRPHSRIFPNNLLCYCSFRIFFQESKYIYKFNSKFFPGSAFYKEYLCQQYGDIQKLPPLELQRPQHLGLSNFIFDYYQDDGF